MILRPAVRRFAEQMEIKLRLNDHKTHYRNLYPVDILHRLNGEVTELKNELYPEYKPAGVIKEAVDVANYAMMLADNAKGDL